ncbi:MAG: Inositol-1-monophosphatase [uncultured Solirubrobacteraceae bacterium]|uniref:inositol-phosphate phosphatase n=1 Tax=uncultured Solirubrobacteraceae bacterium TaxID=1162706 RepID=A0A6J4RS57_9ACTN|nr:MAG: Inositol-1-monophosphatase [uncultured Solirubrobacteraceae bacterium]
MANSQAALEADWLGACRRATEGLRGVLSDHPTSHERVEETGERGEGGDRTLVIDQAAEDGIFAELEGLHDGGARFSALSEERGSVDFGDDGILVVIDPIDGSTNAKRGLPHIGISIAVADGPTMADVQFGFVADLSTGEEWVARRGAGVLFNGEPLHQPAPPERRTKNGKLEVVAIEQADPQWLVPAAGRLAEHVHRLRIMGSIAISLCQVASSRVDGMVALWRTRSVDCAAAQLVVRESGGHVAFPGFADGPLAAPLDCEPRAPIVAARTEQGLAELTTVVDWQDA